MEYQIVRLIDRPEMKEQMAKWFCEKWNVPLQAYLDSMGILCFPAFSPEFEQACLKCFWHLHTNNGVV
ncbi:MAG: hypothetical protein IJ946_00115 [Clostridia bacterium]|nr:hypothetical protein [Clostridia bacterium]